jgi:hypothetical protein
MKSVLTTLVCLVAVASKQLLDLPPRYMWGWEPKVSGYCGSASVQTAAIYHGNWLTEDAIRGTSGGRDGKHELLIAYPKDTDVPGTAISSACIALKLNCTMWNYNREHNPQHTAFLNEFVKGHVDAGHPVIMGLYWGVESDSDFDHIVPLVGYESASRVENVTAVYFNDLHGNASIRAEVADFVSTRAACNAKARFGPGSFCLPRKVDYGIAVSGNADAEGALLPVRLAMDAWSEPDYSREDAQQEPPVLLSATVTVAQLERGVRYALLRFDGAAAVPDRRFLAAPSPRRRSLRPAGQRGRRASASCPTLPRSIAA